MKSLFRFSRPSSNPESKKETNKNLHTWHWHHRFLGPFIQIRPIKIMTFRLNAVGPRTGSTGLSFTTYLHSLICVRMTRLKWFHPIQIWSLHRAPYSTEGVKDWFYTAGSPYGYFVLTILCLKQKYKNQNQ